MSLQRHSEKACLARQNLGHTHLARVTVILTIVVSMSAHVCLQTCHTMWNHEGASVLVDTV